MSAPFEPAADTEPRPPGPLVQPNECVAIALSIVPSMGKKLLSPEGPEARAVLLALKLAGWKIEPR